MLPGIESILNRLGNTLDQMEEEIAALKRRIQELEERESGGEA